jgi:hypothetical protein
MPAELSWKTLDWAALDRMRDRFLSPATARGPCWTSPADLANYDFTFGQRIAWKWDAVLRELRLRGWMPPPGRPLLDWGCGSGVAGRRVVEFFGPGRFTVLRLFDLSPLAMNHAVAAARAAFPDLAVEPVGDDRRVGAESPGVLVLSHVLNELAAETQAQLLRLVRRADAVLWVEPGTHADSRALIAWREQLREQFRVIAPCTHGSVCGVLAPENARHWCHHFAAPPPGLMADSGWVRFAQRAGIDLRRLPYSFLALERQGRCDPAPAALPEGWSRVIGAPRVYKGYAKVLSCQADGVREFELQKRDAPEVFRRFAAGKDVPLFRATVTGGRLKQVEPLDALPDTASS